MRVLSIILILIISFKFVQGQDIETCPTCPQVSNKADFPKIVVSDVSARVTGAGITSGVFTNDPRVENGYYKVDIYVYREADWEEINVYTLANGKRNKFQYTNALGGFSVGIQNASGDMTFYTDRFDVTDCKFEIDSKISALVENPAIDAALGAEWGPYDCPVIEYAFNLGTTRAMFTYISNISDEALYYPNYIELPVATFLKIGTVALKIKDPTLTSGFNLVAGACSATTLGAAADVTACGNYVVVGALDGKNPDISLSGKTEPEGPVAPPAPVINIPTDTKLCLGKNPVDILYTYSVAAPADTVEYYWYVSSSSNNANPISSGATWNGSGTTTVVNWKNAGTYLVNCCVKSKVTGLRSDTVSQQVTVYSRPTATISFNKTQYYPGDNIIATVTGGKAGDSNRGWLKPREVAASPTITQNSVQNDQSYDFQAYVVDENNCKDTTAVQTIAVGALPRLVVEAEPLYAMCTNGVSVLQIKSIKDESGNAVALSNCTVQWSKAGSDLVANGDKTLTITEAGTYTVTVINTNSTPNAEGTAEVVVSTPAFTAPTLSNNIYTVKSTSSQTVIEAPVTNMGSAASIASWHWSCPASASLDDVSVQKPTTTSLAGNTTAFTTYVVDNNNCRSKDATVQVNVNASQGLELRIEPATLTICKGNHAQLTALVNGAVVTSGCTYSWSPDLGSTAEVEYSSNSPWKGEVYVTAEKGGYKATAKMQLEVLDFTAPTLTKDAGMAHCTGDQISVTSSATKFVWMSSGRVEAGKTTNTFAFSQEGTFDMSVKAASADGKCYSDTVSWPTIKIQSAPTLQNLALKSGRTVLCGDKDVLAFAVTSATAPDSVIWYKNDVEVTAARDKYEWTVTDSDDGAVYKAVAWVGYCSTTTNEVTINHIAMPKLNSLAIADTCGQAVVKADAMNAVYEWVPANLFSVKTEGTAQIATTVAGAAYNTYAVKLTLSNGEGKCKVDTSFNLKLLQKPVLSFADGDVNKQCAGDRVTVNSSMNVDYSWYKGNALLTNTSNTLMLAANNANEKLEVIGRAANGCKDTVNSDFRIYTKPVLGWTEGFEPPKQAVISGEKIDVKVTASNGDVPYTYHFDKPYASPITNQTGALADGEIYVADVNANKNPQFFIWVEDTHGCKDTIEASVGIKGVPLDVNIESTYGEYACINGSAILTAHVKNGVGDLVYKWYRNSQPDVEIGSDSVLVVQGFSAADMGNLGYTVKVSCPATQGEGDGSITLRYDEAKHPEAPVVVADPKKITVRQLVETVLGATATTDLSYAGDIYWHWTKEGLKEGEDSKQYPTTEPIVNNRRFEVYVVDENSCMSNVEAVDVVTDNTNGWNIKLTPDTKVICKDNSVKLQVVSQVTKPSLAGAVCAWSTSAPAGSGVTLTGGTAATTTLQTTASATAGSYEQIVKVTQGAYSALAKNTITVGNDQAPKLEFDGGDRYCSGETLLVNNGGWVSQNEFTWIVNGVAKAGQGESMVFAEHEKYAVKVTAKGYGNSCWADTISATVFQTPVINDLTVNPGLNVPANEVVTLTADITPATGVTSAWTSNPACISTGANTTVVRTNPMTKSSTLTYTVKNTEENTCMADSSVVIGVQGSEFTITAGVDSLSICSGDVLAFEISPNVSNSISYEFTSNSPDFSSRTYTQSGVTGLCRFSSGNLSPVCKLTTVGLYEVWIKATDPEGNVGRDTVKFTVRNRPTIQLLDGLGGTVNLCTGNGSKLPVNIQLGGGTSWTVKYSVGATEFTKSGLSTYASFDVTAAGEFKILNVTNNENCSLTTDLPKFTIKDITPKAEFASTIADSVCLPDDVTHQLALKLGGDLTYPLTLFYRKDGGTTQTQQILNAAADKVLVADGALGTYTLDSIRNDLGCAGPATSSAAEKALKRYKAGVPDISFAQSEIGLCQGTSLDIPLTINGGTPAYSLEGTLAGNNVIYTLNPGVNTVHVDKPGTLVLTSVKDKNGCVDADLSGVQIKINDWKNPSLSLTQNQEAFTFCDGGGVAVLPVNVTGGSPDWKIYYKVGTDKYTETVTSASWSWNVNKPGKLVVDSIVSNEGCKSIPAGILNTGITIEDNRPVAQFANYNEETICGGTATGSPVNLTVTTEVWPVTIWYHKKGGNNYSKVVDSDKVCLDIAETGTYILDSIRNNASCKGTVKTDEKVLKNGSLDITVKINAPQGLLCKGTAQLDIPLVFAGNGLVNDATRKFTVSYTYTPAGGVAQDKTMEVTLSEMYANTVKIANAALGQYHLTGLAENGGCSGAVSAEATEHTVHIGTLPPVEIDSVDFVAHKGDGFILGVKNANATAYTYAWQKDAAAYTTVAAPHTVTGAMADADLTYRLKASDKASACYSLDSVTIYRLPEPPTISIDTHTNRNNLIIEWTPAEGATNLVSGYRLMANKWDAYAIETPYSSRRQFQYDVASFAIEESKLDTLEFFYLQAFRNIKLNGATDPTSYYSVSSDTVGYYNPVLQYNSDKSKNNNIIAIYFDPAGYGINKASDIIKSFSVSFVRSWAYQEQVWKTAKRVGGIFPGDFDIVGSMVLQLDLKNNIKFLQYGKLPSIQRFELKRELKSNNNNVYFLQPSRIDLKMASDILKEISGVTFVRSWAYQEQVWKTAKRVGSIYPGDFSLIPLMPLQIGLSQGNDSIYWK